MTKVSTALGTVRGWTGEQTPRWPFLFYSLTHTHSNTHTPTLPETLWCSVKYLSQQAMTHMGCRVWNRRMCLVCLWCVCARMRETMFVCDSAAWVARVQTVCPWQRSQKNWKESSHLSTLLIRFLCAMQWFFSMDFTQYWMVCRG